MRISDGNINIDTDDILIRSKNSLLTIDVKKDDPLYGDHILFTLNDERVWHGQLLGLYEDDHPQYLDQLRHLYLHDGDIGGQASISLDALLDVQIINPQSGEVLRFNGTLWVNQKLTHHELVGLDDFDDHPQYLNLTRHSGIIHDFYNETTRRGQIPHDYLVNLKDVNVTGMQNGQVLVKQGDFFVPSDFPEEVGEHTHDSVYIKRNGTNTPTANLDMGGWRLKNVGTPINPADAATKEMVDAIVWRRPVIAIMDYYPSNPVNGNRYAISHLAEDDSIRGQIIEYQNGWKITAAYYGNAFFNIQDKKLYYWNGSVFNTIGNTIPVEGFILRDGTTTLTGVWDTGDYTIKTPNSVEFDDVATRLDVYARMATLTFQNPVLDIQLPNHDVGYPQSPQVGDRYIASWGGVSGSTPQAIFECYEVTGEGVKWLVTTRREGMVVYSLYHDSFWWYDGHNWERFEKSLDIREMNWEDLHIAHSALSGLLDDDHYQYLRTDGTRVLTGDLRAGGFRLTGLHDGTADTDAVTFKQLLLVANGISWLFPVEKLTGTSNPLDKRVIIQLPVENEFVGHENSIATYDTDHWTYYVPQSGDAVIDRSTAMQYVFNGTAWVLFLSAVTHANLLDAGSATNHNKYLRNDVDGTEAGLVTFTPAGLVPFLIGPTQVNKVERLNSDMVDDYHVVDDPLVPQANRIVAFDNDGNVTVNELNATDVNILDGEQGTTLTSAVVDQEVTHFITLEDLTTRIIRTNAQKMFLGDDEVLTTKNISSADVDMVDGKHASDFAPFNHTHLEELSLNDLKDVDITDKDDNYVLTYDKVNLNWRAKPASEITSTTHGGLAGLGEDDHKQYVHTSEARIITAVHTFDNDNGPFMVTSDFLVENLNADKLDGLDAIDFALVGHNHKVTELSDVIAGTLSNGDLLCYKDGVWINIPSDGVVGGGLTPPTEDASDNVLFSDGMGGTTVNGIKTNQYNQFDLNYNRIKNAVIDCGAYYG